MKKQLWVIIAGAALALASNTAWAADAAAGKTVYTGKCQGCHAADGSGNPGMAKAMGVTLRPLGSAEVQAMSDADLKKVVTAGKGKMKPIATVTGADLDNVVAHIRTLKK
jgi:predicted CXXCH cytochrome family protein